MKNKGFESEKKLTDDKEKTENSKPIPAVSFLPNTDPRVIALVRFLARRAAEGDFSMHLRGVTAAFNSKKDQQKEE